MSEELDSYLYQTVGQDAIEFVARALDVPLYRRVITGNAVEQRSEYGDRNASDAGGVKGDETEDLFSLLSDVQVNCYRLFPSMSYGFPSSSITLMCKGFQWVLFFRIISA